ncbi:hypothetical protein JQ615_25885 [Bradyrhizobium jicamae]|uniref:Uncharacterized protein n=1 Tax=Bradyrhizobium jicamae TaxID=280332 RepID=A0ABS5FPW5_9BRAD|nr:hypothetical protein [Bradyrhizobium jicamae]MBR0798822.1 hypothetical protein [Bradyrhizobium jicamae]
MDNKINEIRRKISTLRAEMTLVEAAIRDQVNRDLDCTQASCRLLAMRAEVAELIARWKASGGGDRLPTVRERLTRSQDPTPQGARLPMKAKPVGGKPRTGHGNAKV